ncbi:MAG: hypothetical protein WD002_03315 [Pseudomonadales bacterium]
MRVAVGYAAAVAVTYLLGTLFISQGNLSAVTAMGFEISLSDRLGAIIHDASHMYDIYLPLVAIALLIAFSVAALVIKFLPDLRLFGYCLAGFVGLIALHVILKAVLGLTGIAPTREVSGLLWQGIAGLAGGLMFHFYTKIPAAS